MKYLRDCLNTEDFEKHFLKPFVRNQINDYKRKLVTNYEEEFWIDDKLKWIIKNM